MGKKIDKQQENNLPESQDGTQEGPERIDMDLLLPYVGPPEITSSYGPDPNREKLNKRLQKKHAGLMVRNTIQSCSGYYGLIKGTGYYG